MTPSRRRIVLSTGLTLVAVLVVWLWVRAFGVTIADVERTAQSIRWHWLPAIFALLAGHVAVSALRWAYIEEALGAPKPAFRTGFNSGAIAMGLGTVLPAPIMNVAARSLANKLAGTSATRGALSGTLDQICDLAICLWMAIPAALALLILDPEWFWVLSALATAIGALCLFPIAQARAILARIAPGRDKRWVALLLSRETLLRLYVLSLLRFANLVAVAILVSLSAGGAPALALAIAVPIVAVANALVMLPGAIGVSEWSFTVVLAQFGVDEPSVIAFVIANRMILTALPMLLALAVIVAAAFGFVSRQRDPR